MEGDGGPDNNKREEGGEEEGYKDGVERDVPTGIDLWNWLLARVSVAANIVAIVKRCNFEL